jgi:hypothetical protein
MSNGSDRLDLIVDSTTVCRSRGWPQAGKPVTQADWSDTESAEELGLEKSEKSEKSELQK